MQQVSYGPLIMSIMLILSCYTGFFNVRRGWQSLNTGPQFYLRLIRRMGWLWIYTSCTTDGHPLKPKLSVPFLYPGVPAGFICTIGDTFNLSMWVLDSSLVVWNSLSFARNNQECTSGTHDILVRTYQNFIVHGSLYIWKERLPIIA